MVTRIVNWTHARVRLLNVRTVYGHARAPEIARIRRTSSRQAFKRQLFDALVNRWRRSRGCCCGCCGRGCSCCCCWRGRGCGLRSRGRCRDHVLAHLTRIARIAHAHERVCRCARLELIVERQTTSEYARIAETRIRCCRTLGSGRCGRIDCDYISLEVILIVVAIAVRALIRRSSHVIIRRVIVVVIVVVVVISGIVVVVAGRGGHVGYVTI